MKNLGSLEEEILLIAMTLPDAYGVSVAQAYKRHTRKSISIPAIHTVLHRLEEKGLLRSGLGASSPERGGRRKRHYEATAYAVSVIKEIRKGRIKLWSRIPELNLNQG